MTQYSDVILADAPLVYWHLSETGAGSFHDAGSANRSLTKVGSTWPATPGLVVADNDGAATLPNTGGSNDANCAAITGSVLTIEFWFMCTAPPAGGQLLSCSNGSNGWFIGLDNAGAGNQKGRWLFQLPGVGGAGIWTANAASGTEYYAAFVHTGGSTSFYLNGLFISTIATGTMLSSAALFMVNGWGFATGAGMITSGAITLDELAIYTTALSGGQVAAHFNAGLLGQREFASWSVASGGH